MLTKRLKAIASLVDPNDKVVDIGTDHAYIPIYLKQNKITDHVIATDISEKVLKNTQKIISLSGISIPIIQSDGFKNINTPIDTAIIAGMGTNTIIDILSSPNIPEKLIIQSNNDLDKLRLFMNKLGYKIKKEIIVYDKIYYDIIKYVKGTEKLTSKEILFGKSNNRDYLKYLKNKYEELYNKSHKEEFKKYYLMLDQIIEKIPVDS